MKFEQMQAQLPEETVAGMKVKEVGDVGETDEKLFGRTIQSIRDQFQLSKAANDGKVIMVDSVGDAWTTAKMTPMGRGLELINIADPIQMGLRWKAIRKKIKDNGIDLNKAANDEDYRRAE